MGVWDEKTNQARAFYTKSNKAEQKRSSPDNAKTLFKTACRKAASRHQHGENRTPPLEIDSDRTTENRNHDEYGTQPKQPKTPENDEDRILSNKSNDEDQIFSNRNKTEDRTRLMLGKQGTDKD